MKQRQKTLGRIVIWGLALLGAWGGRSVNLAMMSCSNSDGYTMGFNRAAFDQSREDVLQFLTTSWAL